MYSPMDVSWIIRSMGGDKLSILNTGQTDVLCTNNVVCPIQTVSTDDTANFPKHLQDGNGTVFLNETSWFACISIDEIALASHREEFIIQSAWIQTLPPANVAWDEVRTNIMTKTPSASCDVRSFVMECANSSYYSLEAIRSDFCRSSHCLFVPFVTNVPWFHPMVIYAGGCDFPNDIIGVEVNDMDIRDNAATVHDNTMVNVRINMQNIRRFVPVQMTFNESHDHMMRMRNIVNGNLYIHKNTTPVCRVPHCHETSPIFVSITGSVIIDATHCRNLDIIMAEMDTMLTINGCLLFYAQPHLLCENADVLDVLHEPIHIPPLSVVFVFEIVIGEAKLFAIYVSNERQKRDDVYFVNPMKRMHLSQTKMLYATENVKLAL